ncbi:MAG: hypothetical protein ACRBBR_14165 [Cellvibrionaceae bacterium]
MGLWLEAGRLLASMAAESHAQTFPKSDDCTICIGSHPCDKECIKAQLEDYYNCGTFTPEPIAQSEVDEGEVGTNDE